MQTTLQVDTYVNKKGTDHPTGIIEVIEDNMFAIVRWGIADQHTYRERILLSELAVVEHEIKHNIFDEETHPHIERGQE